MCIRDSSSIIIEDSSDGELFVLGNQDLEVRCDLIVDRFSSSVFHSLHTGHLPSHLRASALHSEHTYVVRLLSLFITI